jgi:hypothetical protein
MFHENHKSLNLFIVSLLCCLLMACTYSNKKNSTKVEDSLKNNLAIEKSLLLLTNGENYNNDSSFIWTDTTIEFNKCVITRIKDAGFYKYFFWDVDTKDPFIFLQDSIPIVEFISDTLFDVNGDKTKDLIVNGQLMNGQCAPRYSKVFCFDRAANSFIEISAASQIPNPKFFPSKKIVTGEIDCMMKRNIYKLQWLGLKLDTISVTIIPLE